MKKPVWMILSIVCLVGCSGEAEPDLKRMVLERIEENGLILENAFARTAAILEAQGDLEPLVSTLNTRDAFITTMNALVDHVVLEAIEEHGATGTQFATAMEWDASASHHSAIQHNLKELNSGTYGLGNSLETAIDLYSEEIDGRLESGHAQHIMIDSYSFGTSGSQALPTDQFSLNFGQIKFVKDHFDGMLITYTGLEDVDDAFDEFVSENPEMEILIGLLRPAIQKIRAPVSGTNAYKEFSDLYFGEQTTQERKEWDAQMRRVAFLSGIDFIISQDYRNDNQDYASIPLLSAMHHGVTVLAWARIDGTYR